MSHHKHDENPSPYCLNCHHPMGNMDKFCPQCGQKATTGKVSIHDLVHELTHSIFHVDGKLFSTLQYLFVPGHLTVEFFRGHHKRYAHPVQMFVIIGGLCFAALAYLAHKEQKEQKRLGNSVFPTSWGTPKDYQLRHEMDSTKQVLNERYKDPFLKSAFDTLDKALSINTVSPKDTDNLTFNFSFYRVYVPIARADLVCLNADEIIEKYHIKGRDKQQMIRHFLKNKTDNEGDLIDFIFGKMLWMFVFLLPLFGLVLALLYRRHRPKYYFVEHLIFLIHIQSFIFLIFGIALFLIINFFFYAAGDVGGKNLLLVVFIPIITVYSLFALKNFYQQSWGKTILKLLILGLSYFGIFLLGFALTSAAAFFLA